MGWNLLDVAMKDKGKTGQGGGKQIRVRVTKSGKVVGGTRRVMN